MRILLIPLFLFFFFADFLPGHYFWSLVAFGIAAATDALDGNIARKQGLITDFGKLMDPLADKLLVMAAVICLMDVERIHPVFVILILTREFFVTAIRQIAASKGEVLAADKWGKLKTVFQMIWISAALLLLQLQSPGMGFFALLVPILNVICMVLLGLVLVFTVGSGWNYFWLNRKLFQER